MQVKLSRVGRIGVLGGLFIVVVVATYFSVRAGFLTGPQEDFSEVPVASIEAAIPDTSEENTEDDSCRQRSANQQNITAEDPLCLASNAQFDSYADTDSLEVLISPNLFHEYWVDFKVVNGAEFNDQDPTYQWDFGDGETLETTVPFASHSYSGSFDHTRPSTEFQATITLVRSGRPDLTIVKPVIVWNFGFSGEQQASIYTEVQTGECTEVPGNRERCDYTVSNHVNEQILFTQRQVVYYPCTPGSTPVSMPEEDIKLKVGNNQKVKEQFTILADRFTTDICNAEVTLSGQSRSGVPAFAVAYFNIRPNPYMTQSVDDEDMQSLLNRVAARGLVSDPYRISEEDLYRLSGEGKISLPPASTQATGKSVVFLNALATNGTSVPCQPGDPPPPGEGTYDDRYAGIQYLTGYWAQSTSSETYDGTFTWSGIVGSSGKFIFNGSGIRLVYTAAPGGGLLNVSIDGGPAVTINMYALDFAYQQEWSSGALSSGVHTLDFVVVSGGPPVFSVVIDAFIVEGLSPGITCQATGNWIYSPPFIANALKGDIILSAGCGVVSNMLRSLDPQQFYSHTGIMTQDFYQITHSTASEERYEDHTVGWQDTEGFNSFILKYGWPGVITQSIDKAYNGEFMIDPVYGKPYWMVGFHAYPVTCPGDPQIIWPFVVKPPPDAPPVVRGLLHQVADKALAIEGHYRFYVYSNASVVFNDAYNAPANLNWDGDERATVCSQFVWYSVMQANAESATKIILEGGLLEAIDIAKGAEIDAGTPDGLYLYRAPERFSAAFSVWSYIYNKAYDKCNGFQLFIDCTELASKYANQFTNCFANDDCSSSNLSLAWMNPGEGAAVSPDNILFWDSWSTINGPNEVGAYGYSEPLVYRAGEYVAETIWQLSGETGTVDGRVLYLGNPVEGARVTLNDVELFSDVNGEFQVNDVPAGEYEIVASKFIGGVYLSTRQTIVVNSGVTTSVDLILQDPPSSQRVYINGSTFVLDDEAFMGDEYNLCNYQNAPVLDPFHPDVTISMEDCCAGDEVRAEADFILHLVSELNSLFNTSGLYAADLDQGVFPDGLRQAFVDNGISLSGDVVLTPVLPGYNYRWRLYDIQLHNMYAIRYQFPNNFLIYEEIFPGSITVSFPYWLYEGTTCNDNDLDGSGWWGLPNGVLIPPGGSTVINVWVGNEDDWEPDWSWARFVFSIGNNLDVLAGITDLTLTKSDQDVTVYPNDTIVYYLTYTNNSQQEAGGVQIVETVPENATFNPSASTPGWDCQPDGNPGSTCTIDVGRVARGGPYGPVLFAVDVDNPVPAGVDNIYNFAYITDDGTYGVETTPVNNFAGDNTPVLPDTTPPWVVSALPSQHLLKGPQQLEITFSEELLHGNSADPNDVSNPNNYMLVWSGRNRIFDTVSCALGVAGDDWALILGPITYDELEYKVLVDVFRGTSMGDGSYRAFVCGTTSIQDPSGNVLGGGMDYTFDFFVGSPVLPTTGFPPGVTTELPPQPREKLYNVYDDFSLEIPRLGVKKVPIVSVPQSGQGWDVTWLANQVGWLQGTAFPTWAGNSALTAHVYDAYGSPGPFVYLNRLWYGDKIIVHAWGQQYIYEVRRVSQVTPDAVSTALQHEEYPWLTLITCRGYDEDSNSYHFRVVVQAVQVEIK